MVIPLAADLFSLQGLNNLGPTLEDWRKDWKKRLENWPLPSFPLPSGKMEPIGYILQQHMERLSRPVKADEQWAKRIPGYYRDRILGENIHENVSLVNDEFCLARLKHYRSLVPLAQEARKPIFQLTPADGAIGSHSRAVSEAQKQFHDLAEAIYQRISLRLFPLHLPTPSGTCR